MKIHRFIIASLFTFFTGSLLNAQDPTYADELPVTFDDRAADSYFFRDFGPEPAEGEPPNTSVVADPDDASNMVARTNRPANAQTWSGVTFMEGQGSLPGLNNGSELKMSARVRAPAAGIPVLLKAESSTGGGDPPTFYMQKMAHTTKADEWEILTFDFSDPTERNFNPDFDPFLDRLVLFFNFGAANAPPQTYYFDDVRFGAPEVLNLPFDFESDTLEYDFGEGGGFDGGVATIIDNPQMNDANPSAKVGQMVKDGGQTWAGSTLKTDGPINFGINTWIAMDVYSPAAGKTIKFKLEPSTGEAEVDVVTTMANEWETLLFDFSGKLTKEFTNFSLFFGFGEVGDGSADHTYLFDNIRSAPAPVEPLELPLDFEDDSLIYNFTNFDGGVAERMANPDMSGINTSGHVARMVKNGGQVWGGAWIRIPGGLDFSESSVFKMKVWSPRVGVPVLLKLEAEDPTVFAELTANTTMANEWEELTYDFTDMTPDGLTKLVFIFENGVLGEGGTDWTFYFDDVGLEGVGRALDPVDLPVTFEADDVDFTFIAFGGMGETVIADDPVAGASNKVAHAVRTDAAEIWAGTTIGSGEAAALANRIPFSDTATQLSMRVYSPAAGIPIRMKVEDKTEAAISVETEAVTTMANAWETLVFDFGEPVEGTPALDLANTYDKLSIFFNFGTTGAAAGEQTFYYDDILFTGETRGGLGGPMKIDLPITFSDSPDETDYTLTDFGGAVTILGADPLDPTNVVAATQKGPGAETWAGTTISTPSGLKSPIPFTETDTRISVRIYSPAAGIPVLLKVEELGRTDNVGMEVIRNTTVANAWETLVFDFSESVAGQFSTPLDLNATYQKISIFFNFGVTGDDGGELIFYWDDVTFGLPPGQLVNISTRALVGTVDERMIGGFIIRDGPKMVLVQARGPELFNDGVPNTLADPVLRVLDVNGMELMMNDDWEDSQGQEVTDAWGGSPNLMAGSASSAAILELQPGNYTAIVEGKEGTTGIALVEVYDLDSAGDGGNLVNISTRALVGTVDERMIGGFIIRGGPKTVLVQAQGPELANPPVSLSNALADPVLRVLDVDGMELMMNDDWEDSQGQDVTDAWGGSPNLTAGSASSAIILELQPGNYTAIVEGKDGTTGIALVEVYDLD